MREKERGRPDNSFSYANKLRNKSLSPTAFPIARCMNSRRALRKENAVSIKFVADRRHILITGPKSSLSPFASVCRHDNTRDISCQTTGFFARTSRNPRADREADPRAASSDAGQGHGQSGGVSETPDDSDVTLVLTLRSASVRASLATGRRQAR